MPVFNQIFTKEELEELLENEVFHKMTGSKENPLNRPELLVSENCSEIMVFDKCHETCIQY